MTVDKQQQDQGGFAELSQLRDQLLGILATVEGVLERAGAGADSKPPVVGGLTTQQQPSVAATDWTPAWGTMGQAAGILGRSIETTTKHVKASGLGVRVAGRWNVDLNRVRAFKEGRLPPPLR